MANIEKVNDKQEEKQQLYPKQYFSQVKGLKRKASKEQINAFLKAAENMMAKAYAIGQDFKIEKIQFMIECARKEIKVIDMGIDTYIEKDDILAYADSIKDKCIKITELKNYPREIPDEIAELIVRLKKENTFDEYFIVFTDYTNEVSKTVEKAKRDADPILFGVFTKKSKIYSSSRSLFDRFYYIGDWEDEYCDLTLTKLIEESAKNLGKKIEHSVFVPKTEEEIKQYLEGINKKSDGNLWYQEVPKEKKKKSFIARIKTFLTKRK